MVRFVDLTMPVHPNKILSVSVGYPCSWLSLSALFVSDYQGCEILEEMWQLVLGSEKVKSVIKNFMLLKSHEHEI